MPETDTDRLLNQLVQANQSCLLAWRLLQDTAAYTNFAERVTRFQALRDQLRTQLAVKPQSVHVSGSTASYKLVRFRTDLSLNQDQLTKAFGSADAALAFVLATHKLDPKALDLVLDQKTIPDELSSRIRRSVNVSIRPRITIKLRNNFADLLPKV